MKDRDVAGARLAVGERPHVPAKVVVDRQREQVGLVPRLPPQIPHPAWAVANRAPRLSPRAAWLQRRAPSAEPRILRQGLVQRRPELAQLLQTLELVELRPE